MRARIAIAAVVLSVVPAVAADSPAAAPRPVTPGRAVGGALLEGYRAVLSPARGTECAFRPTCSRLASAAFAEHSVPLAVVMTVDCLLRCGADRARYVTAGGNGPPLPVAGGTGAGRFAAWLEAHGEYERAVTEYLREAYDSGGPCDSLRLAACRCRYRGGDWVGAAACGDALLASLEDPSLAADVSLQLGIIRLRQESLPAARRAFADVVAAASPAATPLVARAEMLDALAVAWSGEWAGAAQAFAEAAAVSPYAGNAVRCRSVCEEAAVHPRKDPTKAGVLGLVPGLGYLYAGYPQTALSAALLNGAFLWGTIEAIRGDRPGLATVLGTVGIGWYAGNIYGSVTSARRTNDALDRHFRATLDVGFSF